MNAQTRKFSIFLTALIALVTLLSFEAQSVQAAAGRPTPTPTPLAQADLQKVFQAKLDEYVQRLRSAPKARFILGETRSDGVFAYNTAQQVDNKGQIVAESYVVLLALNDPNKGWLALAPLVDGSEAYNNLLNSFPEGMIDGNTKNYLQQAPSSGEQMLAAASNFSQHKLPFPAGKNGYVSKKNVQGHENQIDFNISPGNTVFASKPGTVVFVKESSNTNCTTPPPNNCWQNANMVVVQHSGNEYSWYVHLVQNSVPVTVGSYIGMGTKIGVEGTTGFSSGVHLHYMASSSVSLPWPNPSVTNVAPWPPAGSIVQVDFDEVAWSNLFVGSSYISQNTSDPAAVSWGYGREDLFVKGEDNVLWHKAFNGSWGAWEPLDGILTSSPDAASWGSSHLDVYVRGLDNNISYRRYLNGAWGAWAPAEQPSVGARSDPSAVSWGNGRIDLFVRGGDDALWHRAYSNGGWANWEHLGGTLTSGPDAASPGSGQVQVFVAGLNNVMWRCTYNNGACAWDQVPDGLARYDQGAVSPASGRTDVFARGIIDGQLYHRAWNGSWAAWEPLGGFLTSGVDAASWKGGHLDIFVRGDNNSVWHRWQLNGPWSAWEPLGAPPSP